ncbi:MAG: carboxypeptidase regulatory-like domain-containing protein [Verrucomicrobia bacterium]|nr:carboxypeptidase regulatory-like domain-containing protein [Verrucomicrobiota bacterium]
MNLSLNSILACITAIFVWLGFQPDATAQTTAAVRGRLTNAVTGVGVEGVGATLDRLPVDGMADYAKGSDPFGMFALENLAPGSYRLRVSHPGYAPFAEDVTLTAGGTLNRNLALTPLPDRGPLPGDAGFDVYVDVSDVSSSLKLAGVEVVAERFQNAADTTAADSASLDTDARGFGTFRGLRSGFYVFHANANGGQPKWESYSTPGRQFLDRAQALQLHLKSIPQTFTVRVVGFDPATQATGSLTNVYVELTGVNPARPELSIVQTMTGITEGNGQVTFSGLPPVAYRLRAKRLGFQPFTELIPPTALNNATAHEVTLALEPRSLTVTLRSPYANSNILADVEVRLTGLKDTNTEGIDRTQTTGTRPNQRTFENLLPGTYSLAVAGAPGANNPALVKPFFLGEESVDVFARGDTAFDLTLTVAPAVIRGRLFAAGDQALLEQEGNPDSLIFGRPVYQPRQVETIRLWEYADDPLVPLGLSITNVPVDEAGNFSFTVLPSRYGLYIPGMTNHWGSHVILIEEDLTDTNAPVAMMPAGENVITSGQGWPLFGHWPYPGRPPKNGTANDGEPLVLNSANYSLDAFVRRKVASVAGTVGNVALTTPTAKILLARQEDPFVEETADYSDLSAGGGMATLTRLSTGETRTVPLFSAGGNLTDHYLFPAVPPGSYRVEFSHPRFTFPGARPTVLVSQWAALPGAIPVSDPGVVPFFPPLSTIPAGLSGLVTPTARYTPSTTQIEWEINVWNEELDPPMYETETAQPGEVAIEFIQPAYASGRIFVSPPQLPVGGFTYWARVRGALYRGEVGSEGANVTHQIFIGGPSDNVSETMLPTARYNVTYRAVSEADPFDLIPGIQITLEPPDESVAPAVLVTSSTNRTLNAHAGPLAIRSVTDTLSDWEWAFELEQVGPFIPVFTTNYLADIIVTDAAGPDAVITVKMRRPTTLTSTVESATSGRSLLAGRLQLSDRFGNRVGERNAPAGETDLTSMLGSQTNRSQTLVLDVAAPGFKPQRRRIAPTNSMPEVTAALEPLPPPVIDSVTVDRFGRFLPLISRSGDQTLLSGLEARGPLTMTWTLMARAQSVTNTLIDYDSATGAPGAERTTVVNDPIREVWLIHPFRYRTNYYNEIPLPLPPPANTNDAAAVLAWFQDVKYRPGVFRRSVANFETNDDETEIIARGQIPVNQLPAGDFNPVFVVVTRGGAVGIHTGIDYPDPGKMLHGVRQPQWLALALEIMGVVSGTQATINQLNDVLPFGPVRALPQFTAMIGLDPSENFVTYSYRLECQLTEGAETPQDGFLLLGPNTLGVTADAFMEFGLNSREPGQVHLQMGTSASKEFELADYLPKTLLPLRDPTGTLTARVMTLGALSVKTPESDFEFELEHEAGGAFGFTTDVEIADYITAVPTVGGIVRLLDETELAQVFGTLRAGVGLTATRTWRTTFPPNREGTSSDPNPHVIRRGLFGQDESRTTKATQFDLCFNFGAGIRLEALSGTVKASAEIALEGSNEKCIDPSLSLTLNPNADWPVIERIQGAVNFNFGASLDLWVVKLGKSWTYEAFAFTNELTTASSFSLAPMSITASSVSPLTVATPATFNPSSSNLISNLFPASSFSASSSSVSGPAQTSLSPDRGEMLLFTDIDPATGRMILKASSRFGAGPWATPLAISSAGGILNHAVTSLPTGSWLAVWTQLDASEVGNPFPATTIMYSTSDASGANWSAPATVATLSDVATELKLISNLGLTGLVYLHTGGGPKATRFDVEATSWDGAQWSPSQRVAAQAEVRKVRVAAASLTLPGSGAALMSTAVGTATPLVPPAMIALVEMNGELRSFIWNGSSVSAATLLSTQTAGPFDLVGQGGGEFLAAVAARNGDLEIHRFTTLGGWTRTATLVTGVAPSDVTLARLTGTSPAMLAAWTSGGSGTSIFYAYANAQGNLIDAPVNLTRNTAGIYSELQLLPRTSAQARVLARFDGGTTYVREFSIPEEASGETIQLNAPRLLADGTVEFMVRGSARSPVRVQYSTDLRAWRNLDSQPAGQVPFVVKVPLNPGSAAQFYRAVAE